MIIDGWRPYGSVKINAGDTYRCQIIRGRFGLKGRFIKKYASVDEMRKDTPTPSAVLKKLAEYKKG